MSMICGRKWSSCAAGAGSAATTTITVPSTLAPGTYYIGAIADYTGVQPETNEANNALAAAATVTVNSGIAQAYYIHTDHLDTPRVITDTNGNVVWKWDNADPFGANMANENPNGAGTFSFNLRFPGQYYDRETNLHYNVNRDYDPAIGRYIESDPIGLGGGINTYTYVDGDPLSTLDPEGLSGASGSWGSGASGSWPTYKIIYKNADPVLPSTEAQVLCMMNKLGVQLIITGGSEMYLSNGKPAHALGGMHPIGEAVDYGKVNNPTITPAYGMKDEVNQAACECSFTYGGWEKDFIPTTKAPHYHYQNGASGKVPPIPKCDGCSK